MSDDPEMCGHEARRKRELRSRLYVAYASTHSGRSSSLAAQYWYLRDIAPHLPEDRHAQILDVGCGQGALIAQMAESGYRNVSGIDVSPEQVALANAANIPARLGDYRNALEENTLDVVTATDFFEHLTKAEVVEAAERIYVALRLGGVCIVRVPNAASPFFGNYAYGDLTHEIPFTARSLRQLGAATKFTGVDVLPCEPYAHGVISLARIVLWKGFSTMFKLALATETGMVRGHLVTQNIVAVLHKGSSSG